MQPTLRENSALRRVPEVRAAGRRETVAMTVVVFGLIAGLIALYVVADHLPVGPPAGTVATPFETAGLVAVWVAPVLTAVGCVWWYRRARARRAAEDVVVAGWPAELAAWYRYARGVETLRSRGFVTMLLGTALLVSGGVTEGFHAAGLRAPLGLHVIARLGLYPWGVGMAVLCAGLFGSAVLMLLSLFVALRRPQSSAM
jgi:hypothetical protein